MCGGGGGTTSTNEFKPPEYTQQGWKDYLSGAQATAANGLTPYGGQTVADMTPMQTQGLQMLSDFTTQGSPERQMVGSSVENLTSGAMNPYAAAANPYMGSNPYQDQMINNSNSKITQDYIKGTAAQNDSAFARSGAFGGSAYADKTAQNEQGLAGALAANTNNILKQGYDQSAQLAEQGLNRGQQGWQQGVQNQVSGATLGLQQQGADQSAIQAMINGGQIPAQYQQQLLDAAKTYYNSNQQAPFTLADFLGSALSRASGVAGTQTFTTPGQSPVTGLLGGAGAAYSMLS
jgi:hypothetical protein